MGIPVNYRKANEQVQANYSYTDIASGLGFSNFYGFTAKDETTGVTYNLGESVYSHTTNTPSTGVNTITMNFNSSVFALPRTVKGTALINFTYYRVLTGTGTYFYVQLKKVNGTTETNLTSNLQILSEASAGGYYEVCMKLPLTETTIKKGEFLRLTIAMTSDRAGGGDVVLYHDPAGRGAGSTYSTILNLKVPFKIDL